MKSQTRKSTRFVNCLCAPAPLLLSLPSPGAPATLAWYFLELARLSSDYRQQKTSSEGLDRLVSLSYGKDRSPQILGPEQTRAVS